MKAGLYVLVGLLVSCLVGCGGAPSEVTNGAIAQAKANIGEKGVDVKVIKCKEGKPSGDFVSKYNPKTVYCVSCQYEKFGKHYENLIAIVNQSGSVAFISKDSIYDAIHQRGLGSGASIGLDLKDAGKQFETVWNQTCPYPIQK